VDMVWIAWIEKPSNANIARDISFHGLEHLLMSDLFSVNFFKGFIYVSCFDLNLINNYVVP